MTKSCGKQEIWELHSIYAVPILHHELGLSFIGLELLKQRVSGRQC
jgi:hypothetical protein